RQIAARSSGSKPSAAAPEREAAVSTAAATAWSSSAAVATAAASAGKASASARSARTAGSTWTTVLPIGTVASSRAGGKAELLIDELLDLFTIEVEIVTESGLGGIADDCYRFGRSILREARHLQVCGRLRCRQFVLFVWLLPIRSCGLLYLESLCAAA